MSEQAPGDWLSVTEAAALAGVSEKTLRKRIAGGTVAARREALKLSARQLPAPGEVAGLEQVGRENRDALQGSGRDDKQPGGQSVGRVKRRPGRAIERTPRPLWKLLLGVR
jgi:hypothetical protein